jgi:hypothetical protein
MSQPHSGRLGGRGPGEQSSTDHSPTPPITHSDDDGDTPMSSPVESDSLSNVIHTDLSQLQPVEQLQQFAQPQQIEHPLFSESPHGQGPHTGEGGITVDQVMSLIANTTDSGGSNSQQSSLDNHSAIEQQNQDPYSPSTTPTAADNQERGSFVTSRFLVGHPTPVDQRPAWAEPSSAEIARRLTMTPVLPARGQEVEASSQPPVNADQAVRHGSGTVAPSSSSSSFYGVEQL